MRLQVKDAIDREFNRAIKKNLYHENLKIICDKWQNRCLIDFYITPQRECVNVPPNPILTKR